VLERASDRFTSDGGLSVVSGRPRDPGAARVLTAIDREAGEIGHSGRHWCPTERTWWFSSASRVRQGLYSIAVRWRAHARRHRDDIGQRPAGLRQRRALIRQTLDIAAGV
jgi:hypothetical protein